MKKLTKILVLLLILPLLFVVSCSTTSDGGSNEQPPVEQNPSVDEKPTLNDFKDVHLKGATFEYDGQVHSLVVEGELPKGTTVEYTNNDQINAGVYEVSATLSCEGYNTLTLKEQLTITKKNVDIQFLDQTFIYDGTEKEITIVGTLPEGVTVSYENNKLTDVGGIVATAYFTQVNENYNIPESLTAVLEVTTSSIDIQFNDYTTTYDGFYQEMTISSELPSFVSVWYENNYQVNAGEYLVTAYFTSTNSNYTVPEKLTAKFIINKADYNVTFNDKTFTYDGWGKNITVDYLPYGINVRYENNKHTNAGEYIATAYLSSDNYNVPEKLTAKLTINKAQCNINFNDKEYTYDGNEHEIVTNDYIPQEVTISYENNKHTNAGEYIATLYLTSNNYDVPEKLTAKLIINKAELNLSELVEFKDVVYEYDGTEKTILATYPETLLSVYYSNNKLTNPNFSIATATFTVLDTNNYKPLANNTLKAKLTVEINGLEYRLNSFNKAIITNYTGDKHDLIIPNTIDGFEVVEIGSSSFKDSNITDITLADSVNRIESGAFMNCDYLSSVKLSPNIWAIYDDAFNNCRELRSIELPEKLQTIGSRAFMKTPIDRITIPSGLTRIDAQAFYNTSISKLSIPNSVEYIGEKAFNCVNVIYSRETYVNNWHPNWFEHINSRFYHFITSFTGNYYKDLNDVVYYHDEWENCWKVIDYLGTNTIVDIQSEIKGIKVNEINNSAFEFMDNITSIIIPDSVTNIGSCSFRGCSSLTSVTIPDSLSSIGWGAFYNCSSLTSVTLPNNLISIDGYAFYKCSSLTSIVIPNSVTSIGDYVFYKCSSLTSITIPNGVTSIGLSAFSGCSSLTSLTIPNGVTSIGDWTFNDCSSLTNITIPNGVTSIGLSAFSGCSSLTNITIPNGVTSIGNYAFSDCSSLTSITIPNSITRIGWDAFGGCSSLTSITIPNSITSIGSSAFRGCSSLTSIAIPDSVTSIDDRTFSDCSSLTSITIPSSVTSVGGYVFSGCLSLTSITIPSSVTSVGSYAFSDCSSLTSITIPNGVTSIGEQAFKNCTSLSSITLPGSLKNIEYKSGILYRTVYALDTCTSLKEIILEEGITSIGNSAFSSCHSLTSITIPNSVTSIGSDAFSFCRSLKSVTLSNTLTSIGSYAFGSCSNLTEIIIPISVVKIESDAFASCTNLKTIYCEANEKPVGWSNDWLGYSKPEVIWGYKPKQ